MTACPIHLSCSMARRETGLLESVKCLFSQMPDNKGTFAPYIVSYGNLFARNRYKTKDFLKSQIAPADRRRTFGFPVIYPIKLRGLTQWLLLTK